MRAWQPSGILTLIEVKKLRKVLENADRHVTDRLLCGHSLHLLYGRARWSDLLAVQHVFMDECGKFLELQTQLHNRSKLLPVVTPCEGIVPGNWAQVYLTLGEECGLELPMEGPGHMLPAPSHETGKCWRQRYLITSEEGAEFLRLILGVPKKSGRTISSHSFKSTAMSWASKFGIYRWKVEQFLLDMPLPLRTQRWCIQGTCCPQCYVSMMQLQAIRQSGFEPDKTRSGIIAPSQVPARVPGTPPSLVVVAGGFGF